jgi:hypothetical protein
MTVRLSDSQIQEQLAEAVEGLTYMSETDSPFQIHYANVFYVTADTRILSLDEFFETAIVHQDWHDEEDRRTVERFQALVNLLKTSLIDAKVYLFGQTEVIAYMVGLTPSGNTAGLRTNLVET